MNPGEFPISLWPGVPIDPPPVRRGHATVTEAGWLIWGPPQMAESVSGPYRRVGNTARWEGGLLDPEVVIRELLTVDTRDQTAVIEFANRFGQIDKGHPDVDDYPPKDEQFMKHHDELVHRIHEETKQTTIILELTHWLDVAEYLYVAQCLAMHFVAFHDGDYLGGAWRADPDPDAYPDDWYWKEFVRGLNLGLAAAPPRAEYLMKNPEGSDHALIGRQPMVDLYSALCIQLYNLILEGGELKTCANETCRFGGRFINQRGTAKHGQHRSIGVKYCTNACARIQGTRDNRRRKRAEAKEEQ